MNPLIVVQAVIVTALLCFTVGFWLGYHALKYDTTDDYKRLRKGMDELADLARTDPVRYGIELGKEWSLQQLDAAKDRIARTTP